MSGLIGEIHPLNGATLTKPIKIVVSYNMWNSHQRVKGKEKKQMNSYEQYSRSNKFPETDLNKMVIPNKDVKEEW